MITQYTRLVVDKATNEILHCASQDSPFVDGWEPVDYDPVVCEIYDFELDADVPDSNFGVGRDQEMIHGRDIIENFEIKAGKPQLKSNASQECKDKCLRVSDVKDISETAIKKEMSDSIIKRLAKSGQTESELIESLNKAGRGKDKKIMDLPMVRVIRIKKEIDQV